MYCYLNGKILPLNKAAISPCDLGLLRGYGVFDYLRTYRKKPFLVKEHYLRLKNSARTLNLKVPIPQKEFENAIEKLVIKNKIKKEASIRIVVTGGESKDGFSYDYLKPTCYILVAELHVYPASIYKNGAKLISCEFERDYHWVKTLNYITAVKMSKKQKKAGSREVLYYKDGLVTEATRSNFFIFKGNTLATAKDKILLGITRGQVLKLARKKFKVEEREVRVKELKAATEAFITSGGTEITPIVEVDKIKNWQRSSRGEY